MHHAALQDNGPIMCQEVKHLDKWTHVYKQLLFFLPLTLLPCLSLSLRCLGSDQ